MDISKLFQDSLLVILLLNIHSGLCLQDDDYDDGPAFGRCPGIRNKFKNGRVRYRYKGRIAKFLCDSGFELAGKRSSTCVRGQWSNPVPVCVARGCSRVPSIANGRVTEMYRGGLLVYDCNPGYTIAGDSSIHCDGRRWNASPPVCGISTADPETHCEFESPYLCGWSHDPTHDFDWKRNQFSTPSGHVGTGPSHDHTFGEHKAGYYLYIEASSPRKLNDTTRLFSPVYSADESGGCFIFWYHMYGATTGGIRVYLKPESHVFGELSPKWEKFGDQGNKWLRGNITVPLLNENFQIVIEGIRGESYVGDSAIDDVQLTKLDCESMENVTDITTENTIADSCRGRCRGSDTSSSCGCNDNCLTTENCCVDYLTLCTESNETASQHTDEPLPVNRDYYGKTTSLVTVPGTLTSLNGEDVQTSTTSSNLSSHSISPSSTAAAPSTSDLISEVTVTSKHNFSPSSSSTSVSTTEAIAYSSTEPTLATKSSTGHQDNPSYLKTDSTTDTPSPKTDTTVLTTTPKTTVKMTTVTTTSLKTSPATKSTEITSTSSTAKPTVSTSKVVVTTAAKPTTSTTTQISSASTTMSTTVIPKSPTFIPVPTTSTPKSTIVTTTSTASTPTSTITTSTTETTTISKSVPISVTWLGPSSSSTITTEVSSSISTSSSIQDTTTPRYHLRPRKTTTKSTSTTTLSTTAVTEPKTEIPSTSTVISSTRRRWFTFTAPSTTTAMSTTKLSATTTPRTTTESNRYDAEPSKPPYRIPKSTPISQTSSQPTESNNYEMIESKAQSSKSNGSSAVTISIVVIVILCVAAGLTYYLRKYRNKRQSKLDDDSEMRFLPESDYMDYSDASALDKILVK